MTFLVVFDRLASRLVAFENLTLVATAERRSRRLAFELEAASTGNDYEIVVVEAPDERAVRTSYAPYFYTTAEVVDLARRATPNAEE